jgi:hypothetical protein
MADREAGPVIGDGGLTLKAMVYQHYKGWCEDNNLKPLGRNHFYERRLSAAEGRVTDPYSESHRGLREFEGIKLTPTPPPTTEELLRQSR